MELRTEGLAFSILFMLPPDDEGWMWCNSTINVPSFRGDLDFQLLVSDLDSFRSQLSTSLIEANWPCEVRLANTDPGIDLLLRVERTGQVQGEYVFGGRGTYGALLSGVFVMDQTYLGPLVAQVERVFSELA